MKINVDYRRPIPVPPTYPRIVVDDDDVVVLLTHSRSGLVLMPGKSGLTRLGFYSDWDETRFKNVPVGSEFYIKVESWED